MQPYGRTSPGDITIRDATITTMVSNRHRWTGKSIQRANWLFLNEFLRCRSATDCASLGLRVDWRNQLRPYIFADQSAPTNVTDHPLKMGSIEKTSSECYHQRQFRSHG